MGRQYKACSTWKMTGEERNTATVVLGLILGTSMDGILMCVLSDHLKYVYTIQN